MWLPWCLRRAVLPLLLFAVRAAGAAVKLAEQLLGEMLAEDAAAQELGGMVILAASAEQEAGFLAENKAVLQGVLPYETIRGTTPQTLTQSMLLEFSTGEEEFSDARDRHNNKARAIFVSHSNVLRNISAKGPPGSPGESRPYVVVEHDVRLGEGWKERLRGSLASAPEGCDLVLTSYWGARYCPDALPNDMYRVSGTGISSKNVKNFAFYSGLQSYVVTPRSARKLLAELKQRPVRNIDRQFLSLAAEGKINECAAGYSHLMGSHYEDWWQPPYSRYLSCSQLPL